MKILVTGGAGYIGSHTCLVLLEAGHEVVVYDNLSNSRAEAVRRVEKLSGRPAPLVVGDIRDRALLQKTLSEQGCEAVIHFAGLKAVGESVEQPLRYYDNNVGGTISLLQAMEDCRVHRLVFSSSATVYGEPQRLPLDESHPLSATNPYGRSKLIIEDMLRDLCRADARWRVALLRYFNPVGAHESGEIGEDPQGIPNNLMPFVAQVAVGLRDELQVWGDDYDTPDGTGVRDYIHVMDLAEGHLAALEYLQRGDSAGCTAINLGTGQGYSVLDMVRAFETASGRKVPYRIADRRPGDVAACWADPSRARELLGWSARRGIGEMCRDHWNWQQRNPRGYRQD